VNFYGSALTKAIDGYVITSILNTNDEQVEIQELLVELNEMEPVWIPTGATEEKQNDREKRISEQLRLYHLNEEGR
jgi:hypothetical protein